MNPYPAGNLVGDARERLAVLAPGLDPCSQRAKMGLLLLVAATAGCNIDRLARLTGIEREAVAKFSRRLFDAGVVPRDFGGDHEAFWEAVSIAEGKFFPRVEAAEEDVVPTERDWPLEQAFAPRPAADAATHADRRAPVRSWPAARGAASPTLAARSELFPDAEWLS